MAALSSDGGIILPPRPIAIRLDSESPDWITVFVDFGEGDRPLTRNSRLLFVHALNDLPRAMRADDDARTGALEFAARGWDSVWIYDVNDVLDQITNHDVRPDQELSGFVSDLIDLQECTPYRWPPTFRRAMYGFSNHVFFSHEYGDFFDSGRVRRTTVVNATMWALGCVASSATFLPVVEAD